MLKSVNLCHLLYSYTHVKAPFIMSCTHSFFSLFPCSQVLSICNSKYVREREIYRKGSIITYVRDVLLFLSRWNLSRPYTKILILLTFIFFVWKFWVLIRTDIICEWLQSKETKNWNCSLIKKSFSIFYCVIFSFHKI